jgi:hypothetical protein
MFAALTQSGGAPLTRAALHRNWQEYLNWARQNPQRRKVMHMLLEAGLVSAEARAAANALGAGHWATIADAHERGVIRGPSVEYIARLIFFHLDLVIDMAVCGDDEADAFDMLCRSIGLST